MRIRRRIFSFCTAAALLFSATAAMAVNPSYELGLEASSSYRYSETLKHFTRAAEQGDRDAQRSLGLMLLYGERLYGRDVPRNHEQAKRWLQAAAGQGCAVSSFMLKAMARHGG